jgi:phosphoribosyl 1,2-cyclic phosphate phosphodiesterase
MNPERTFTFLGTGTSTGVPMIGCECGTCTSDDLRNQRYRCAVLISTPRGRILIDTPPELRLQLLREKVPFAHAVLLTHYHADHLHGLDDVRVFPLKLNGPVPIYCNAETEAKVRSTFDYACLDPTRPANVYVPQLDFHRIAPGEPFSVIGERILPILLEHAHFRVLGFRLGNVAYCTDVSRIPDASWPLLEGLDVLVLDALRHRKHPAHFSIGEALEVIAKLRPRQAYLTHLSHDVEHAEVQKQLPAGVELAYDGLRFEF